MGLGGTVSHSQSWGQTLKFTASLWPQFPWDHCQQHSLSTNQPEPLGECMELYICPMLGYFGFQIGVYNNLCFYFWKLHFHRAVLCNHENVSL